VSQHPVLAVWCDTLAGVRLVVIFGPPAVGKMTVGRALTAQSRFRLFHNHAVLEPLLEVFDYGTPPFMRLVGEWAPPGHRGGGRLRGRLGSHLRMGFGA